MRIGTAVLAMSAGIGLLAVGARAGPNQFKNAEENGLAVFRNRDEVYLRVRYTF